MKQVNDAESFSEVESELAQKRGFRAGVKWQQGKDDLKQYFYGLWIRVPCVLLRDTSKTVIACNCFWLLFLEHDTEQRLGDRQSLFIWRLHKRQKAVEKLEGENETSISIQVSA